MKLKLFDRLVGKIERFGWNLIHRFHPKHRYYVVKTGLAPGYYDPDIRMLNACFTIFCEWYEYNFVENDFFASDDDRSIELARECTQLYYYWTTTRVLQEEEVNNFYDSSSRDYMKADYKSVLDLEDEHAEMEDQMMIKLMKIRRSLWYL